ncbi:hypothetical protein NEOC65_002051 [Neochlamydia sp. AcF65]|nr:hypothetical protein [Neochlamydia sp. AcF65]
MNGASNKCYPPSDYFKTFSRLSLMEIEAASCIRI